jgi:hypothetical protein
MARSVDRFLGGSPLAVIFKLILLSILIGVVALFPARRHHRHSDLADRSRDPRAERRVNCALSGTPGRFRRHR